MNEGMQELNYDTIGDNETGLSSLNAALRICQLYPGGLSWGWMGAPMWQAWSGYRWSAVLEIDIDKIDIRYTSHVQAWVVTGNWLLLVAFE